MFALVFALEACDELHVHELVDSLTAVVVPVAAPCVIEQAACALAFELPPLSEGGLEQADTARHEAEAVAEAEAEAEEAAFGFHEKGRVTGGTGATARCSARDFSSS